MSLSASVSAAIAAIAPSTAAMFDAAMFAAAMFATNLSVHTAEATLCRYFYSPWRAPGAVPVFGRLHHSLCSQVQRRCSIAVGWPEGTNPQMAASAASMSTQRTPRSETPDRRWQHGNRGNSNSTAAAVGSSRRSRRRVAGVSKSRPIAITQCASSELMVFRYSLQHLQTPTGGQAKPSKSLGQLRCQPACQSAGLVYSQANHAGGYLYRLAPADGPITEEVELAACQQSEPVFCRSSTRSLSSSSGSKASGGEAARSTEVASSSTMAPTLARARCCDTEGRRAMLSAAVGTCRQQVVAQPGQLLLGHSGLD